MSNGATSPSSVPAAEAPPQPLAALQARVGALEEQNELLSARLAAAQRQLQTEREEHLLRLEHLSRQMGDFQEQLRLKDRRILDLSAARRAVRLDESPALRHPVRPPTAVEPADAPHSYPPTSTNTSLSEPPDPEKETSVLSRATTNSQPHPMDASGLAEYIPHVDFVDDGESNSITTGTGTSHQRGTTDPNASRDMTPERTSGEETHPLQPRRKHSKKRVHAKVDEEALLLAQQRASLWRATVATGHQKVRYPEEYVPAILEEQREAKRHRSAGRLKRQQSAGGRVMRTASSASVRSAGKDKGGRAQNRDSSPIHSTLRTAAPTEGEAQEDTKTPPREPSQRGAEQLSSGESQKRLSPQPSASRFKDVRSRYLASPAASTRSLPREQLPPQRGTSESPSDIQKSVETELDLVRYDRNLLQSRTEALRRQLGSF